MSPLLAAWLAGLLAACACAVAFLPATRQHQVQAYLQQSGLLSTPSARRRAMRPAHQVRLAVEQWDLELLLTEVTMLLRSGAPTAHAWERVLERQGVSAEVGDDGLPRILSLMASLPDTRWQPPSLKAGAAERKQRAAANRAAIPGVIAACRLSTSLGAPLAQILDSLARGIADAGRAHASRAVALAGQRSTSRLLMSLPLLGLALGALIGADPIGFLLDGSVGTALAALAVGLMVMAWWWSQKLVAAAMSDAEGLDQGLVLQMAEAALQAGSSIPNVLSALGDAAEEEGFGVVARALLLGSSWQMAWQAPDRRASESQARQRPARDSPMPEEQAPDIRAGSTKPRWRWGLGAGSALQGTPFASRYERLESALRPAWEDGADPGPLLVASARSLRAARSSQNEQAAQRLAVRLVLPLGLCSLPAFIILGIVPVIASVGQELLS